MDVWGILTMLLVMQRLCSCVQDDAKKMETLTEADYNDIEETNNDEGTACKEEMLNGM